MLRLMQAAHPHTLNCEAIFSGTNNPDFASVLHANHIPVRLAGRFDVPALAHHFRVFRTDVAYLFGQIRSFPWIVAARWAKVPVIVGAERSAVKRRFDKIARQLDHHWLDAYICNARVALDVLRDEVRVPIDRLFLVYNGLDEHAFRSGGEAVTVELGRPVIVCVANILPLKGQYVLLEAVAQLRHIYPQIRAVLVGKDQTGGRFFAEANAGHLHDVWSYAGFVPDVRPYLARADAFVLPSLYYEGTSTAILEAMAAGVPVIATDVGGTRELIDDGETGLLVPPGDSGAIARQLHCLLESADLREKLVRQAQLRVQKRHTMSSMLEGHVAAFQQVLARKTAGRQRS